MAIEAPFHKSGFLFFCDIEGTRHAVRLNAITAVRDADEVGTETQVVIHGRGVIATPYRLSELFEGMTGDVIW